MADSLTSIRVPEHAAIWDKFVETKSLTGVESSPENRQKLKEEIVQTLRASPIPRDMLRLEDLHLICWAMDPRSLTPIGSRVTDAFSGPPEKRPVGLDNLRIELGALYAYLIWHSTDPHWALTFRYYKDRIEVVEYVRQYLSTPQEPA